MTEHEHTHLRDGVHNDVNTSISTERESRHKAADTSTLSGLRSDSSLLEFSTGTGETLFADILIPAILSARREIILATCFWATGPTLDSLSEAFKELSRRLVSSGKGESIDVHICFSSRSLLQKLFHTSSPKGYIYPSSTWPSKLGLPAQSELPGLKIRIKSLFFRPFSVLHSKYLIIDRKEVYLPSCNVSWEEWYECCVHMTGPLVSDVFDFWKSVWDVDDDAVKDLEPHADAVLPTSCAKSLCPRPQSSVSFNPSRLISTALLPHSHNSSARYNLWFLFRPEPPRSPLNTALLNLFASAKTSITLLTPNFTSQPVYDAILAACERGVNVRIITNRKMMILEQLVTSGTISEFWLAWLKKAHQRLLRGDGMRDLEQGRPKIGHLKLEYFRTSITPSPDATAIEAGDCSTVEIGATAVKTHVKLTLVDNEFMILGSGNMDRASWFTSQELGIMFHGQNVVQPIWDQVEKELGCHLQDYC